LFCVFSPMLTMSLGCPFLVTPSVFSNIYLEVLTLRYHYTSLLTCDNPLGDITEQSTWHLIFFVNGDGPDSMPIRILQNIYLYNIDINIYNTEYECKGTCENHDCKTNWYEKGYINLFFDI
jgi:hypothetical protein